MKKKSLIYVAGHNGMAGAAVLKALNTAGYQNILTRSRKKLDLKNYNQVEAFLKKSKPEYIFFFAGKVGGILANNTYPAEFIYENLAMQNNIIDLSYRYNVKKLLFLACSCAYPKKCPQPIKEEYLMAGALEPTNEPFAVAKLAGIKMCQAYARQYKVKFIPVISGNLYGPNEYSKESGHVVASLIWKFYKAKTEHRKVVEIWGSGKPKRDFLYVDDLAEACIFLMKYYNLSELINIGTGIEASIRKLANLIAEITDFKGKIAYNRAKSDGNLRRFLDISKINRLGWFAKTNLNDGLVLTYNWFKQRYIHEYTKKSPEKGHSS